MTLRRWTPVSFLGAIAAACLSACNPFTPTTICDTATESGGGGGRTGSMARLQVAGDRLYALAGTRLEVVDLSRPGRMVRENSVEVGFGMETLFATDSLLYMGANNGMHVYDLRLPSSPTRLSGFWHVRSCDPVVVQGGLAYVTLRGGGGCRGGANELQILDVADPSAPRLLKAFPMVHPHGVGVDGNLLFLCDGGAGLKVFGLEPGPALALAEHVEGVDAYDVIPAAGGAEGGPVLILSAKEGLMQFDYSEFPMRRLGVIPIGEGG